MSKDTGNWASEIYLWITSGPTYEDTVIFEKKKCHSGIETQWNYKQCK